MHVKTKENVWEIGNGILLQEFVSIICLKYDKQEGAL